MDRLEGPFALRCCKSMERDRESHDAVISPLLPFLLQQLLFYRVDVVWSDEGVKDRNSVRRIRRSYLDKVWHNKPAWTRSERAENEINESN